MSMNPIHGPVDGLEPRLVTVELTAYAALSKGDVVAVSPTVANGKFYTTQAPASDDAGIDDNEFGMFVVALEDIASGAKGQFAVSGIVDCLISGTPAAGVGVSVKVTTKDLIAAAAANKCVGYMLETGGNGTGIQSVLFDGWNGFGMKHA